MHIATDSGDHSAELSRDDTQAEWMTAGERTIQNTRQHAVPFQQNHSDSSMKGMRKNGSEKRGKRVSAYGEHRTRLMTVGA